MVNQETADRLRALWKSGRDKYASFYAILNEVRLEIGDEALPNFCFDKLHIGISRINEVRKILTNDDAARVKADMEAVVAKERARKAAEAHAAALAKIERENELSAKRLENAERKAAERKLKAEQAKKDKMAANRERRAAKGDARDRAMQVILADPAATRDMVCQLADVSPIIASEARARLEASGRIAPKGSDAAEEALYQQYVEEGRRLTGFQWKLGDLAIKVSALKRYGEATLEHYAADIGAEYSTLKTYMATARAWDEKVGRPTFSIAQALATHPDRAALVADNPHMTVEQAREIMRAWKAASNVVPLGRPEAG